MRTYEEIDADARDGSPFSNGTEGEGWMANWCYRPCIQDKNDDCPLILVALMGKTPAEWMEQPRGDSGYKVFGDQYHCIEFRSEEDGPNPEPQPIPDPPDQGLLLPREPFEATRMFVGVAPTLVSPMTDTPRGSRQ